MRFFALVGAAAALCAATVTDAHGVAPSCDPRPFVDAFVQALNGGDLDRVDAVFATGEPWAWYSVADIAGQRLRAEARNRGTLRTYFARRIAQRERLHVLRFQTGGNGNFTYLLRRQASDLRSGRPVERQGKGWVNCETGKIGVWSLGGAPPPASFGPCPRSVQPLPRDLAPARRAVLVFVRNIFAEMTPSIDVRGARVTAAVPAPGVREGYAARVRCSRAVQRRTAIVRVDFPRVTDTERLSSVAFYVSRTHGRWFVWRLIP